MTFAKTHIRHMTLLELLIGMFLTAILLSILTYFYQDVTNLNVESEKMQAEIFKTQYIEHRLGSVIPTALPKKNKNLFYFFTTDMSGAVAPCNPSLVFLFQTGVDLDPSRSVTALGQLFLDSDKKVKLAVWSYPDEWEQNPPKAIVEDLIDNVKCMRFNFFIAPERDRSIVPGLKVALTTPPPPPPPPSPTKSKKNSQDKSTPETAPVEGNAPVEIESTIIDDAQVEPEPKGQWVPIWKKEYQQLPSLVKIDITRIIDNKEVTTTFAYPLLKSNKVIVYE